MENAMDAPDMLSLGRHCSAPDCGQRDFLPFTCDCCNKVYCLEHRTYSGHNCQQADRNTATTIVCPLCARAIKIAPGENPNLVFEQHSATGCDPSNYARVMQKKRCPVPGCKEKLTTINTYTCKHCSVQVCLKHRFPDDHKCARKPNQQGGGGSQAGAAATLRRLFNFSSEPSVVRGQTGQAAASAAPKRQQSSAPRPRPAQPVSRNAQGGATLQEFCPVCDARFHTVGELLTHSRAHQLPADAIERCPHCQITFHDAVSLVEHVERQHSSNATACVVS